MSGEKRSRSKAKKKTNNTSEILIDKDGRVFVTNLSGELLDALKSVSKGDPTLAKRYSKLRKFKGRKGP